MTKKALEEVRVGPKRARAMKDAAPAPPRVDVERALSAETDGAEVRVERRGRPKRTWRPLEDTVAYMREHRLYMYRVWKAHVKTHGLPEGLPREPHVAYGMSWRTLAAHATEEMAVPRRRGGKRKTYAPYALVSAWAQERGVRTLKAWRALYDAGELPPGFPKHPQLTYREWTGTAAFFGKERRYAPGRYDLEVFRAYLEEHGICTLIAWEAHAQSTELPAHLPRLPIRAFKRPWNEILGRRKRGQRWAYWPYEQAQAWARRNGITTKEEYMRRAKRLKKWAVPVLPEKVYEQWTGWPDFLGVDRSSQSRYLPYEEARELARSMKFRTGQEYREYATRHPELRLPSTPHVVYRVVWAGYGPFLWDE